MDLSIDFGELSNDDAFKKKILDLKKCIDDVSKVLDVFLSKNNYGELSLEDKIRYDLFLAFAINTFYWIYLRTKGIDTNSHDIKHQINRVKEYMVKSKKIYEKKTIMPRLNQEVAQKFIRNGLWTPKTSGDMEIDTNQIEDLVTKKRKRDDAEDYNAAE